MSKLKLDLSNSDNAISSVKESLLSGYQDSLVLMLNKYGYDYEKFTVTIVNALKKNPKLMNCTKESIVSAVLSSAELGLEIDNPLGYCYMIPFFSSKNDCYEAKFIIGYKGIVELLYRSPRVKKIVSEIVYENDEFSYKTGSKLELNHVPTIFGDTGKRIGTYTIITLDNNEQLVQFVRADQIEALKKFSSVPETYNEANDPMGNMWKKSAIRQIIKYTPKETVPIIGTINERDNKTLKIEDNEIKPILEETNLKPIIDTSEFGGLLE